MSYRSVCRVGVSYRSVCVEWECPICVRVCNGDDNIISYRLVCAVGCPIGQCVCSGMSYRSVCGVGCPIGQCVCSGDVL